MQEDGGKMWWGGGPAEVVGKRYLDPRQTLFQLGLLSVSAHHDARLEYPTYTSSTPSEPLMNFPPIAFLRTSCLDGSTLSSFTH